MSKGEIPKSKDFKHWNDLANVSLFFFFFFSLGIKQSMGVIVSIMAEVPKWTNQALPLHPAPVTFFLIGKVQYGLNISITFDVFNIRISWLRTTSSEKDQWINHLALDKNEEVDRVVIWYSLFSFFFHEWYLFLVGSMV